MYSLRNFFNNEPAAISGFLRTLLLATVLFGLDLSEEMVFAIVTVVESFLTLLTRNRVTPNTRIGTGDGS